MPVYTTHDGCRLEYRLRGKGPLIALTPGGREPGEAVAGLADELAARATVLTWDRRNCGASDVWFGGDSEADVWADDLSDLIAHTGMGKAWLAGGSAGCRVSALSAVRRPQTARGLLLWSASGGPYGCQFLGYNYHVPYIMACERAGMAGVAATPFFAERIACNPSNRERLLALDPAAFVATLLRWTRAFYYHPEATLAGVADTALRQLAMPVLLVSGNDDVHPASVSTAVAGLITGAQRIASPWSNEQWLDKFTMRGSGSVFDLYPLLAPALLAFASNHGEGR